MTQEPHIITDNLDQLLAVLPDGLSDAIAVETRASLIEIVLDLGRQPEARFTDSFAYLRESPVTREDLDHVEARLGAFGDDNRAGIPATLHRISAMRNRRGIIVGLTLRVGRAVMGIVDILRDLIESGDSVLLMGRPGLGKTTLLRELARVLADEMGKRVVIVDTSNEIAGDGDVPHPAIGRARRMQVARVQQQHDVMIEAVENHMPEVVVIDEIGRTEETLAARTIAERGVQLVATVHGNTLDNLLANPTMSDLIGGIQAVTLSDEEARRRRTQKTVLERKAPPTFDVIIEMIERDKIAVRRPVLEVVDALLRGQPAPPELRWRDEDGNVQVARPESTAPSSRFRPDGDEFGGRRNGSGGNGSGGPGFSGRGERNGDRFERRFDRSSASRFDRSPFERSFNERAYGDAERGERPSRERKGRAFNALSTLPLERELVERELERELGNGLPRTLPAPGDLEDDLRALGAPADELEDLEDEDDEPEMDGSELDDLAPLGTVPAPVDVSRVRRMYPFGVSRSRLARAVKHLGLPLTIARTWQDADAVLMLTGADGLSATSSLLREARESGLAIIGVRGNTYAQILARLNELFTAPGHEGHVSARELAMQEARNAIQRVLSEAEPIELRPQAKTLRRLQHQLAQRYHLRSYSVGRDPHRRVRFLPNLGR